LNLSFLNLNFTLILSSPVIQITNLSKSYIIAHEGQERYTVLRDVVAQKAKKIFSFSDKRSRLPATKEEFWALKDISFQVAAGDRIGIIGRNGAGKSTLLKIISRITEPTTGTVKIKGRVASLLEVGTGFHPELTGRENIFLNGAILGMTQVEIRKHFDAIVDFAEIEKFLDTPVKRYSSGMYVRLAFAVAAHLEPEILVVDEVLAVGDAQFQKKCLGKMEDVSSNEGRTILFVSHQMGVISQLCQKVMLLRNGALVEEGETRKVIDQYMLSSREGMSQYVAKDTKRSKDIYFSYASTINSEGDLCEDFMFDQEIILKVGIRRNVYDPGAKVSITFQNTNGDFLSTIVEDLSALLKEGEEEGEFKVKFSAGVLAPNSYAFRLAVFHHKVSVYDLVEMICPIKVSDNGTNMALFEGLNYGNFFIGYKIIK
jgi:lipopolysaccharide transport system ATP-binding protein